MAEQEGISKGRGWFRIPDEKRLKVTEDYKAGKNMSQIAEEQGVMWDTVKNIIKKAGLPIVRNSKRNEIHIEDRSLMAEEYKSGMNSVEIATKHGVSQTIVSKIVREFGATRSTSNAHRSFSFDESSFDVISEESAYWIGFLMADGGIVLDPSGKRTPSIHLGLQDQDLGHVIKFKSFLKSDHAVTENVSKLGHISHHFQVRSSRLVNAIAAYGVLPKKSHTAKVVGLENNRHFWRGVIDGDGCIHLRRYDGCPSVTLVGSLSLMNQFLVFLKSFSEVGSTVRPLNSIFQVAVVGNHAVEVVREIYYNSTIYLDRKYALAKELL